MMLSPGLHDKTVEVVATCPLAQVAVVNGTAGRARKYTSDTCMRRMHSMSDGVIQLACSISVGLCEGFTASKMSGWPLGF